MERQRRSGTQFSYGSANQSDGPTLGVVAVRMHLEGPAVMCVMDKLADKVKRSRDLDVCIVLRRFGVDVKHIRLLPHPLQTLVRRVDVYGNSAVWRRVRTDKEHFHR